MADADVTKTSESGGMSMTKPPTAGGTSVSLPESVQVIEAKGRWRIRTMLVGGAIVIARDIAARLMAHWP